MQKSNPYSSLKIFAHPEKVQAIEAGERTAPIYIRLKPTNVCNHHCYYCSYADDALGLRDDVQPGDFIAWDKLQEIIGDMGDMGVKAVTLSGGGEPLAYPWIVEAMRSIADKGIDLSIITNGQLLDRERAEQLRRAKWVRISFDAATAKVYEDIRGLRAGMFASVCDNIGRFAKLKASGCELGINYVIHHKNAHQVYDAAKLVKGLGVNHIKYAARITKDLFEYHLPYKDSVVEQLRRVQAELADDDFKVINKYEEDFDTCMLFERNYDRCHIKEIVTCIAADSKLYFCHDKAYVTEGVVADLKEMSFKDAWFSPQVRERYRNFDPRCECKHHCVFDDRNILLNQFVGMNRSHINFI
jgi:MoaA/NifB/PqqE/SkfB family radical SAM enzyme